MKTRKTYTDRIGVGFALSLIAMLIGLFIFALISMWKAANDAKGTMSFEDSILKNQHRFGMVDQTIAILLNTAKELGW